MNSAPKPTAVQICDEFAWNNPPSVLETCNFAHMNKSTFSILDGEHSCHLKPFHIEDATVSGFRFCGLIVVIDEELPLGVISPRR